MVKLLHLLPREATPSRLGIAIDQTAFKIPRNTPEYSKQQSKGACEEIPEQEGQLPNIDLHRPEHQKFLLPDSYGML